MMCAAHSSCLHGHKHDTFGRDLQGSLNAPKHTHKIDLIGAFAITCVKLWDILVQAPENVRWMLGLKWDDGAHLAANSRTTRCVHVEERRRNSIFKGEGGDE